MSPESVYHFLVRSNAVTCHLSGWRLAETLWKGIAVLTSSRRWTGGPRGHRQRYGVPFVGDSHAFSNRRAAQRLTPAQSGGASGSGNAAADAAATISSK